jgi:hypothetical protein
MKARQRMDKYILQNKIYDMIQSCENSLTDGFEYYGGDDAVEQLSKDIADMVLAEYQLIGNIKENSELIGEAK